LQGRKRGRRGVTSPSKPVSVPNLGRTPFAEIRGAIWYQRGSQGGGKKKPPHGLLKASRGGLGFKKNFLINDGDGIGNQRQRYGKTMTSESTTWGWSRASHDWPSFNKRHNNLKEERRESIDRGLGAGESTQFLSPRRADLAKSPYRFEAVYGRLEYCYQKRVEQKKRPLTGIQKANLAVCGFCNLSIWRRPPCYHPPKSQFPSAPGEGESGPIRKGEEKFRDVPVTRAKW